MDNINFTKNVLNNKKEELLKDVKHVIAVASGKGGVGKSTVASNLSIALSKKGKRVGLLDADIYGPTIPALFNVKDQPSVEDNKMIPIEKYGIKLISIGFLIEEDSAVIWRGPLITGAIKQFITDVKWGELDFLIVDLPPGTGDASLTIAQTLPLKGVIIVTTPQKVAAKIAGRASSMFKKMNINIFGFVENMSYFKCPHCGKETEIFAHGGSEELKSKSGIEELVSLPFDTDFMKVEDKGEIFDNNNLKEMHEKFSLLADKIIKKVENEVREE